MGEYYAITRRRDDTLQHWANQNPNAKEKSGHKYVARDWINGKWVYFYDKAKYDAFRTLQRAELKKRSEARRREFFKRTSARLYNATESFKDWSGLNARAEVNRARKEEKYYAKAHKKAREATGAARDAYRVADRYAYKNTDRYRSRYAASQRAYYRVNERLRDAQARLTRALTAYGNTPIGAAHNAARRGAKAVIRFFRKR